MTWDITDKFPSWGEAGEFPVDGFFYQGGDQVNEKHMDALWNALKNQEDEIQAALLDIDSDKDGEVDAADIARALDSSEVGTGLSGGDGTALSLDESVIKDGGPKEIDVQEFAGGDGTSGQMLFTDGADAYWDEPPETAVSEDGTQVVPGTSDINFSNGISVVNDGDGTVTVDSDENSLAYDFVTN